MNSLEVGQADGWRALKLDSGPLVLTIPLDVGPRITAARWKGGPNLFAEREGEKGGRGEAHWCIRGGHRLWHSPEDAVRTYELDNSPISWEALADGAVRLLQPTEPGTRITKEIVIRFPAPDTVEVRHRLRNDGLWPVELAPWALTVMRVGGYGIIPLPQKGEHPHDLLPACHLVPWPYTDLSLPLWQIQRDFIGIDTTLAGDPQKLGVNGYPGWSGYWLDGVLFVKHAPVKAGAAYPDLGSAFETFSCDWMLELETLGPLVNLAPGESVEHVESWGVFGEMPHPAQDGAYRGEIAPAVGRWLARHGLGPG